MAPLVVFLIRDKDMFMKALEHVTDSRYHVCLILSNKNIAKNLQNIKHQILIFDFDKYNNEILLKIIISYTDAIYSHYLIYSKQSYEIENDLLILENEDFINKNGLFGFSKNYYIFNDVKFEKIQITIDNPFEHFDMMEKALNGEIVDQKYFMIALEELLPDAHFKIECDIPDEILKIISTKNNNSKMEYLVSDKLNDGVKHQIIFTPSKIETYNFIIKRDDNFNCYIL